MTCSHEPFSRTRHWPSIAGVTGQRPCGSAVDSGIHDRPCGQTVDRLEPQPQPLDGSSPCRRLRRPLRRADLSDRRWLGPGVHRKDPEPPRPPLAARQRNGRPRANRPLSPRHPIGSLALQQSSIYRRIMENLSLIAGIWGSALATLVAAFQFFTWRKGLPKIGVRTGLAYSGLREDEDEDSLGTPIRIQRGLDVLTEQVALALHVTNRGGTPAQIAGILIETLDTGRISRLILTPDGLPEMLAPNSSITVSIPKEHVDMATSVVFLGVLDGTGNRHCDIHDSTASAVRACWKFPTRAAYYKRKDGRGDRILAYQTKVQATLSSAHPGRKDRPIIERSPEERDAQIAAPADRIHQLQ